MLHNSLPYVSTGLPSSDAAIAKWHDAMLAIELMVAQTNIDSSRLPAIRVQSKHGPVVEQWISNFTNSIDPIKLYKVPVGISMEGLVGGLDLSATLTNSKPTSNKGLLAKADGGVLVIHACEDLDRDVLSTLLQAFENGFVQVERDGVRECHDTYFGMLVIDSTEPDDDLIPDAMLDRLGIHINLDGIDVRCLSDVTLTRDMRSDFRGICGSKELEAIVTLTQSFGFASMRPAMQMIELACFHAAYDGRERVMQDDIQAAIRLSLINRAKCFPSSQEETPDHDQSEPESEDNLEHPETEVSEKEWSEDQALDDNTLNQDKVPDELDIDTMLANLPPDMLDLLRHNQAKRSKNKSAGRAGSRKINFKRGRRLSSIKGRPGNGLRLDLISTLRTAAPWQRVRKEFSKSDKQTNGVWIRPQDFQVRRFQSNAESTTIFVVDASGSTAINRLGEAKGAIEILLNESYSRRDHVALIAMRGNASEVLLPPSRSLVKAKRSLSKLAGGGGTPLAHGLQSALTIAEDEARRGRSASIVVLTDGSANIAMDGRPGRPKANEDAIASATAIGASGYPCLIIDVSKLPGENAKRIADAADGTCLAMPFASSHNISNAVLEHRQSG